MVRAQRLSASKIRSQGVMETLYPPHWCSTPFGIKDQITELAVLIKGQMVLCSTPFGIKDQITFDPDQGFVCVPWCSTPFGIKDQITPRPAPAPGSRHCAQRLSASKIRSP